MKPMVLVNLETQIAGLHIRNKRSNENSDNENSDNGNSDNENSEMKSI